MREREGEKERDIKNTERTEKREIRRSKEGKRTECLEHNSQGETEWEDISC